MPQEGPLTHSVYSDLIEDTRKWYRIWWDNIKSIDLTDLLPSLLFSGGPAAYFILAGAFTVFSISTAGIGLATFTAGAICWQLFKYPIKRFCANIIGRFTVETPKWGLRTPNSEKAIAVIRAEAEHDKKQNENQIRVLLAKLEGLVKSNQELNEQVTTLRATLVRITDQARLNEQVYETKNIHVISEISSAHEEQLEQSKLDHENQLRDLRHEHKKAIRALTHQLTKLSRTYEALKINYAKLSGNPALANQTYPPPLYSAHPSITHFKPTPPESKKNKDESSTLSDSSASRSPKGSSDTE